MPFELTRNLILGGQSFGGMFGVVLDTPREIRAGFGQALPIDSAFAGFSGYTVLLLILVLQEFTLPFTATLEANDLDEEMRLLTVWLPLPLAN